jgi:SWI/SNF-related matrix-associated actin-dependent regulator 1 of chromatin subfamily A
MQLYPHQEAAVQWLIDHNRCGLFDEQGLGKTISVIVAASRLKLKRVLVVCPTSVLHNWQREIERWDGRPALRTQVIQHGTATVAPVHYTIMSHGMLLKPLIVKQLRGFDLIVLDEAHAMRNASAIRSRVFYLGDALCRRTPRTWVLTGTPVPNNPSELWTMFAGLDPERLRLDGKLMNSVQFRDRFCEIQVKRYGTRSKVVVTGLNKLMLPELRERVKGFALRRLKSEALSLPAMRWSTITLTADATPDTAGMRQAMNPHVIDDVVLEAVRNEASFSEWRHACGRAKIEPACEMLENDLDSGMHKVVVFAHHRDVIEEVRARLFPIYGAQAITGATASRDRQLYVDLFQNDPQTRVLVCQLQAGGQGVTLTAAQDVVFIEQSFIPGENAQAADRCHRIGQTKPVLVRFLSLARSIDERLVEILARKSQMIKEVLQ